MARETLKLFGPVPGWPSPFPAFCEQVGPQLLTQTDITSFGWLDERRVVIAFARTSYSTHPSPVEHEYVGVWDVQTRERIEAVPIRGVRSVSVGANGWVWLGGRGWLGRWRSASDELEVLLMTGSEVRALHAHPSREQVLFQDLLGVIGLWADQAVRYLAATPGAQLGGWWQDRAVFVRDNELIADRDGEVQVLAEAKGTIWVCYNDAGDLYCSLYRRLLHFRPDGSLVHESRDNDTVVELWRNPFTDALVERRDQREAHSVYEGGVPVPPEFEQWSRLSPDGAWLLRGWRHSASLVDVATMTVIERTLQPPSGIRAEGGNVVIRYAEREQVYRGTQLLETRSIPFDLTPPDVTVRVTLNNQPEPVVGQLSPDGNVVVTEDAVRFVPEGTLLYSLPRHGRCDWSPSGRAFVTALETGACALSLDTGLLGHATSAQGLTAWSWADDDTLLLAFGRVCVRWPVSELRPTPERPGKLHRPRMAWGDDPDAIAHLRQVIRLRTGSAGAKEAQACLERGEVQGAFASVLFGPELQPFPSIRPPPVAPPGFSAFQRSRRWTALWVLPPVVAMIMWMAVAGC